MPAKSKTRGTERTARTAAKGYVCLRGFSYPTSKTIRDRNYAGDHIPRGELKEHKVGDKITNLPSDVIKSMLRRGAVELIKKEEVSSDTPK